MQLFRSVIALVGVTFFLSAQIPDFTPPTPLLSAIVQNNASEVRRLLDSGAGPNEGRFLGAPPILAAFLNQNPEIIRALIARGADVKATDGAGSTTLMWAAASETADASIVKELIQLGVDVNAKNKMGDDALAWAMRRGHTPVVEALKQAGASDALTVRQSVERAVALLQKSGPEFLKVSGCTSCHHQSLPQMANEIARQRGVAVDSDIAAKQAKAVIAMFRPYREQMMQGKPNLPDPAVSVSYALLGLGAEKYPRDDTTKAMARIVGFQQTEDGSFRVLAGRPPMESSIITATALSMRALQLYGTDTETPIKRGVGWLRSAAPQTGEERSMRLLGLAWGKAPADVLRASAGSVVAEQRPDGGWAQLSALESDAYATGQAMVALATADPKVTSTAAWQRGVGFLMRTQRPDGSWLVRTRAFPFQPLKESGFPHGRDQWISASGTSWAAMALAMTMPPAPQQLSKMF